MFSLFALFAFPIVTQAASSITISYPDGFIGTFGNPTLSAAIESITGDATVYGVWCTQDGCDAGGIAQYTDLGSGTFQWEGIRSTYTVIEATTTVLDIVVSISCTPNSFVSTSTIVCDEEYTTLFSALGASGSFQTGPVWGVGDEEEPLRTSVIELVSTSLPPVIPFPTQTSGSMSDLLSPPTVTSSTPSSSSQVGSSSSHASGSQAASSTANAKVNAAAGLGVDGPGAVGAFAAAAFICAVL
jgi:hypothetical protein